MATIRAGVRAFVWLALGLIAANGAHHLAGKCLPSCCGLRRKIGRRSKRYRRWRQRCCEIKNSLLAGDRAAINNLERLPCKSAAAGGAAAAYSGALAASTPRALAPLYGARIAAHLCRRARRHRIAPPRICAWARASAALKRISAWRPLVASAATANAAGGGRKTYLGAMRPAPFSHGRDAGGGACGVVTNVTWRRVGGMALARRAAQTSLRHRATMETSERGWLRGKRRGLFGGGRGALSCTRVIIAAARGINSAHSWLAIVAATCAATAFLVRRSMNGIDGSIMVLAYGTPR